MTLSHVTDTDLREPPSSQELKAMLRQSVLLAALENLMQYDDCPVLRAACRARFLDLTDGKLPK